MYAALSFSVGLLNLRQKVFCFLLFDRFRYQLPGREPAARLGHRFPQRDLAVSEQVHGGPRPRHAHVELRFVGLAE